jgi:hypothetical protein
MSKRMKKPLVRVLVGLPVILLALYFGVYQFFGPHVNKCANWDDIDSSRQEAIKSVSFEILEKMAASQYEDIWDSSHPAFKKSISKEQLEKTMKHLSPLLTQHNDAEFIDGRLAKIFGYKGASQPLFFGLLDVNSPDHLRAQTLAGAKESAIAMIKLNTQPIGHTLILQMAKDKGKFKMFRFDITPASYHNKTAKYYQVTAEKFADEQKFLPAYLTCLMAVRLSNLGPTLKTGQSIVLEERLLKLSKNQILKNELTRWELPDRNYTLFGIGLMQAQDGFLPRVRYLAQDQINNESTAKEAAALMEYVETYHPEIAEVFDNILFEAYTENPTNPEKQYNGYRTVLHFKSEPN